MKIKDIKHKIVLFLQGFKASGTYKAEDIIVEIEDDSAKHAHHIAMKQLRSEGNESALEISHLRIKVVCAVFEGMRQIERHKLMHKALEEEYKTIHSISFILFTPSEV